MTEIGLGIKLAGLLDLLSDYVAFVDFVLFNIQCDFHVGQLPLLLS